MTIQQRTASLTGVPCAALPLEFCRVTKPYLLDKYHLSTHGTALFFAVPYLVASDVQSPARNLSLYAVPRDYHAYVRALSDALLPQLYAAYPTHHFALFADHSPLAEVEGAARAGLGMIGDNGLLITKAYGSFVFLCELITDAGWEEVTGRTTDDIPRGDAPRCPGCGACRKVCPGKCIGGDRTTCLSALTQKKGPLSPTEAAALAAHPLVWGCDTCQIVCPLNRAALSGACDTPLPFFREERIPHLTREALDAMSGQAFSARAYAWRGRETIRRNLIRKEKSPES